MKTTAEFKKYYEAQKKAGARAGELTAFIKENTPGVDWPEGMTPEDMQHLLEKALYESEKSKDPHVGD